MYVKWIPISEMLQGFSTELYYPTFLATGGEELGFLGGSAGKESAYNVGDLGLIPGLGRSPGEGKGYPLQYSGLENSMACTVHGIIKSQTRLSNFHTHKRRFTSLSNLQEFLWNNLLYIIIAEK